jgi:protein SCO1/2
MQILIRSLLIFYCSLSIADTHDESLYQLKINLTDQGGAAIGLDTFRGQPVLVGMFYADCPYVCPLTIHTLQRTEAALDPVARAQLRVLLVSLDPARDTPEKLDAVARRHKLDNARWKLARTDEAGVRKLAAVLGVRFKQLPDGEFNHSTVITLLDRDGVQITSSSQLGQVDPAIVDPIRIQTDLNTRGP